MTVAEQIAEQIRSDNPHLTVRAYGDKIDTRGAGKVLVQVYRTSLAPAAQANVLEHTVQIDVVIGTQDAEAATARLDDALDEVLLSLQRMPGVSWSQVERSVYEEQFPGWSITASAQSTNVYRQVVLAESE